MISINESKNYENELVCYPLNHNLKGFEKYSKNYEIFQTSLNNYVFLLSNDFDNNELYRSILDFFANNKKNFNVDLDSFLKNLNEQNQKTFLEIFCIAAEMATNYSWIKKEKPEELANLNLKITCSDCQTILKERLIVASAQTLTRNLQDAPSNYIVPGTFCKQVQEIFKDLKNEVSIEILNRKELEKKGLNLLVGVGQASDRDETDPKLLVISYKNDSSNANDITAFVGKGVCFDTGGLNIKTAGHMRWMKYDMSGAAIVAMTLYALAKNKIKGNFVAVCPLVINLCDKDGQRPDDVVQSYLGKTVEIDNTDAEGRLILADALTYAWKDLKATRIFDIATLTGAMIYGLGDTFTGVWTNSDDLWSKISVAANQAAELVWRMPFHNDFLKLLKSNIADIANSVSDPRGGSSRAACFLKEFTNNLPYAHFDIAATASKNNLATGIMLNTFYNFAKNLKK